MEGRSERGPWVRGGFVIETGDEYMRTVAFTLHGEERAGLADGLVQGQRVSVDFKPESREFNGRWYTELKAYRVSPAMPVQPVQQTVVQEYPYAAPQQPTEDEDSPF